jgi:alpha-tubulin suppressor-like RCC1 family protein
LGDGTANSSSVPVDVSGITNAVAVVAATSHSCALLATGEVVCWGDNTQRQLGNANLADAFSNTPVSVGNTAQAGVSNLAASGSHSCAISGGGVICWGDNNSGQLGDGTGLSNSQPVNVADVDNVVSMGLGYSHGCAVRSDGTARCWGRGFNGELGNGQSETAENYVYPKPITHAFDALGTITHFSTGLKHACAVIGAAVYCVGDNARGQLGDGTQQTRTTPVQVSGLTDALQVYAGFEHSCALRSNSSVVCWGANDFGQLGNGLTEDVALPTAVGGLSGIVSLSAGYRHTCAATGSGNVYCWGDNDRGSLGVGVFDGIRNVPMQVRDLATAIQVDASGAEGSSCAVLSTGLVACWGANSHGELGHGSLVDSALPIVIPSLSNITKVSTGGLNRMNDFDDINPAGTHCAIDSAGAVYCWGAASSGQMGLGSGMSNNAVPVRLPLSRPALSVDVGGAHGCAVLNNNTVECWGANNLGQLGIGVDSNDYSRPIAVPGLTTATRLTADRAYTCALLTGGDMQCWGENGWAQMGGGLTDITRRVRYQPPLP